MYLFICIYQPWVDRLFLFNLNELGIGEGTQANPKCLKNLKVINKPSMVMRRSIRNFNIPPRANPGHLTVYRALGGGNLNVALEGWGI